MSGPLVLPFHSSTDQCDKQNSQSLFSESTHYSPGVAQHALFLGPGRPVVPDIIVPIQPAKLVVPALDGNLQRDLLNLNFHAWLLEPRLSRERTSPSRCQRDLKLQRNAQPELAISKVDCFCSVDSIE